VRKEMEEKKMKELPKTMIDKHGIKRIALENNEDDYYEEFRH
jgi:hypothetical protein